jgi:cytoskeletal protein RodZ
MPSFGEELRQAREERGVSLRQISDATHIGIRFLQAIESDNYAILPGGIFNRSFVKSYARYIGIDEEQALARYNQQLEDQGGEPPRVPASRFEGIEEDEPSSWGSISLIILILIILGLGGYGAWRYFRGNAAKANESANPPAQSEATAGVPSPAAIETPPPSVSPAAAAALPSPSPETSPPVASAPPDALRVKIEARDQECWIKVRTDEGQSDTRILKPGEVKDYVATGKIVLNLGNLPALNVTINGRPAKLPARANGTVAENVIITKDNYQKFIE